MCLISSLNKTHQIYYHIFKTVKSKRLVGYELQYRIIQCVLKIKSFLNELHSMLILK